MKAVVTVGSISLDETSIFSPLISLSIVKGDSFIKVAASNYSRTRVIDNVVYYDMEVKLKPKTRIRYVILKGLNHVVVKATWENFCRQKKIPLIYSPT